MDNIILIGMMGSGKSTISKVLKSRLKMDVLDTDDEIEKGHNLLIKDIFKEYGESYFRDLEYDYIKSLKTNNCIISTGGGMIIRQESRNILKQQGIVFYLNGSIETLVNRLMTQTANRPLLDPESLKSQLESLLDFREKMYLDAAHYTININDKGADEICEDIYLILKELGYKF